MSEIGIIGATYEDRRTKKQGKLIERDEKYKTLLMEASDGKSFNITFGGFRSNWRKVDEPEQTLEEAMEEIPVPEPVKKEQKPVVKKKKKENKTGDVNPDFENTIKTVVAYLDSFCSNQLSIAPNFDVCRITVKIGRYKFVEMFCKPRTSHITVACKENVAKLVNKFSYIDGVNYYATRKPLNYAFNVSKDGFDKFLEDFRQIIVDELSKVAEEE